MTIKALHADLYDYHVITFCSHRSRYWDDKELTSSLVKEHRLVRCKGCGKWHKLWEHTKENPSDHLIGEWSY